MHEPQKELETGWYMTNRLPTLLLALILSVILSTASAESPCGQSLQYAYPRVAMPVPVFAQKNTTPGSLAGHVHSRNPHFGCKSTPITVTWNLQLRREDLVASLF
jgi:hypothetical protein